MASVLIKEFGNLDIRYKEVRKNVIDYQVSLKRFGDLTLAGRGVVLLHRTILLSTVKEAAEYCEKETKITTDSSDKIFTTTIFNIGNSHTLIIMEADEEIRVSLKNGDETGELVSSWTFIYDAKDTLVVYKNVPDTDTTSTVVMKFENNRCYSIEPVKSRKK